MKKITTPKGVFGPYTSVEQLADRWRVDGADLPFSVIGEGVLSDAEAGDFPPPPVPPLDRAATALQIDEAVAAIYDRFTRFQLEYTERESQAQAFRDADYAGAVPPRVAEFSVPAGMSAQAAANLILSQAVSLRDAQGALSALRMRKYEVLRAESDAQAQTAAVEIIASIAAVGAQVS